MKNLRIALGYKTGHRNSEPTVLSAGFLQPALQASVDAAPAEFLRFEFGTFLFGQRARRTLGSTPTVEGADTFPIEGPTEADILAMGDEIKRLGSLLADERTKAEALLTGALGEIERLKAELAARNSTPHDAPPAPPSEAGPVAIAAEPPAAPAAEATSSAAAVEGDGPSLNPTTPADGPRSRRR